MISITQLLSNIFHHTYETEIESLMEKIVIRRLRQYVCYPKRIGYLNIAEKSEND